ncbi:MAG: bifunctional non-ous end joining protein LigD [Solirubrobacteraceae bacterium]|jgi:bifunctional non-homologous end joining protein LigD|nr:bifunctional non-ous end joining protein LigD [Solirubrobacteraceae bacterium]
MAERDRLADYRSKRDLEGSPEPAAAGPGPDSDGLPRFVVQEHHATALHWDLRLEHEGALASWAVPKGIPPDPKKNHLAVRTEDHPLEYLDFHGTIPDGHYGAGTMFIWDHGTFEVHKWRENEVMVTLHGERVQGKYVLFPTGGKNWMIHRMSPPQDPAREPLPESIEPMLARTGKLPADETGWAFELKWDGVRALAFCSGGRLRLQSRSGRDITAQYPELRGLAAQMGTREAVLDGEIVAFDEHGQPSFGRLQSRMNVANERQITRLARDVPAVYIAFDLLWLEGHSRMAETYTERRAALTELKLTGPSWQVPGNHVGDGAALLELTRARGLEGVVAKRMDSTYLPGRRATGWIKVKNVRRVSAVIGGWLPGEGGRSGSFGALALGFYEDGVLRYCGRVGTGFDERELGRLMTLLEPLARKLSPFEAGAKPPRQIRWVEPQLVCDVEFTEWTHTRTLRAPSYKGLRDDVSPEQVEFDEGG